MYLTGGDLQSHIKLQNELEMYLMICRVTTVLCSNFFQRSCPICSFNFASTATTQLTFSLPLVQMDAKSSVWPPTFGSAYTQYDLSQAHKSTLGPESAVIPSREKSRCPNVPKSTKINPASHYSAIYATDATEHTHVNSYGVATSHFPTMNCTRHS